MSLPTFVVDAHQDLAYNYVAFGRDYRQSAHAKRQVEADAPHVARVGSAMTGLPDAIMGRIAVVFATLFVAPRKPNSLYESVTYTTPREAYTQALRQWDYYQRLFDEEPRLHPILRQSDLDAVLADWGENADLARVRQGVALLMEGADPILEPKQFEEWYERGVRIVGPAWERTRYSGGTHAPGGLTALGRELMNVLADYRVVLDLSHAAEEAFFDALDAFQGESIIASHSNPRSFVPTDRHLSDTMIRRLAERDGVIGVVLYNHFIDPAWRSGSPKHQLPAERVLDAIDTICQMTGSAAHVGIGSDFDGGFGVEDTPAGFDTAADLWSIGSGLRQRGYSEADISAVLGGNMLRKLRQALP